MAPPTWVRQEMLSDMGRVTLGNLAANAASGSFMLSFSRVVERYLVAALFLASGKVGKI